MNNMITIALTKGRILNETLPLFADAGIQPLEDMEKSRKLIFPTNRDDVRFLLLRGVDVPTYVRYGAADMGVSGKDMLLEEGGAELYEPLDLNIAKCRLMTAGLPEKSLPMGRVRVATKFVNVAKDFYARQGVQVDVIKLYGAMELAPIMGLCDRIVDIVDTGNTLRANGLVPMEHIADVSTRLVVNKASLKMKHQKIDELIKQLSMAVDARK
ncbi:MAG: phosphoribosyltransferase [Pseudomonadota bacterium]|jgi:ATP phosphoribosyltransferase